MTFLNRMHRFAASQGLYPLILATLLSLALFAVRIFFARTGHYSNLVWNLFLAWIPYGCSVAAYGVYRFAPSKGLLIIPIIVVWLLFFPNAPYILTDFLHLQKRPSIPLWYDIGVLSAFSITGLFLGVFSLRTMQFIIKKVLGAAAGWFFALLALLLSGLGIYMGRIGRWNSWDLLFSPIAVLRDTLERAASPNSLLHLAAFSLLFAGILLVSYLMFTWVSHLEPMEAERQE